MPSITPVHARPDALLDEVRTSLRPLGRADTARTDALLQIAQQMLDAGAAPKHASRQTLERLGDRWSTLLLFVLSTGDYRHGELRRVVSALSRVAHSTAISQRMLTLRLRALERDGLVTRRLVPGNVVTVDYGLSPMGTSLIPHLRKLVDWCSAHDDEMRIAQQAFDAQQTKTADWDDD